MAKRSHPRGSIVPRSDQDDCAEQERCDRNRRPRSRASFLDREALFPPERGSSGLFVLRQRRRRAGSRRRVPSRALESRKSANREENADLRFDAFSFFTDGQPYVFLSTSKTPERDRFDAAHELGHLVMHNSPVHKETKTRESEANLFASAFLMPAADVKAVCPFNASINAVKNLKIRWGVAATALCTRLFQLDMSTDWVRYSVMKGLAKEGYRSGEPGSGMHHEKSKICSQVLRDLMKRHEMSKLSSDLCQEPNDIASLTFNCLPIVKSSPQFGVKSVGLLDSRQRAHDLGLHVVDGGLELDV